MRLARFLHHDIERVGLVDEAGATIRTLSYLKEHADPLIAVIEQLNDGIELSLSNETLSCATVTFLPPIVRPSKNILCVGKNYAEHAREFSNSGFDCAAMDIHNEVPRAPIIFSKPPSSMIGAFQEVTVPWALTNKVDYEAELGVVIGKMGRNVQGNNAYEYVWGYTIINDVTARDLQAKHQQWLLGKAIDTFCPIGPWIVSADEVSPESLDVKCWVNDELRQEANTKDLIFDIPTIIETISAVMTLFPGDIIATGTPAGVGIGFKPPKFLQSGDVVRISIGNIGEIRNTIR